MAGEFTRRTENNQNIWTCVREGLKKNLKNGWINPLGLAGWGQPGSEIQPKKK